MGLKTRDHDLSRNQELAPQLTEPPRRPYNHFFLKRGPITGPLAGSVGRSATPDLRVISAGLTPSVELTLKKKGGACKNSQQVCPHMSWEPMRFWDQPKKKVTAIRSSTLGHQESSREILQIN